MTATEARERQEQQDKLEAERLIATVPRIPEVVGVNVELYTDNTGDPAFELFFQLRLDVEVDKPFLKRFHQYTATVQTKILHSDLNRFPYTRIRRAA